MATNRKKNKCNDEHAIQPIMRCMDIIRIQENELPCDHEIEMQVVSLVLE